MRRIAKAQMRSSGMTLQETATFLGVAYGTIKKRPRRVHMGLIDCSESPLAYGCLDLRMTLVERESVLLAKARLDSFKKNRPGR